MAEGEKFNWVLTAIWWCVLFVGAMYLMIVTATEKTIVIADSAHNSAMLGEAPALRQTLLLENTGGEAGVFFIPLEEDTKAGNVIVENSYYDRELRIFIGGAQEQFYADHAVNGDVQPIVKAERESRRDGVLICLQLDSVYEFQTGMDGDVLRIKVNKPKDLYSMVVVADPAKCVMPPVIPDGSSQPMADTTEELTLAVCRLLEEQWDMEQVKVYYTRREGIDMTEEECLALVDAVDADIYIRLDMAESEDATVYGIGSCYNEEYFIPEFGNVELADVLTRNVTIAAGNRATGLSVAEKNSILYKLQIPSACVELGYSSNTKERVLLTREGYRSKLANGIKEAVREVYTNYYEEVQ